MKSDRLFGVFFSSAGMILVLIAAMVTINTVTKMNRFVKTEGWVVDNGISSKRLKGAKTGYFAVVVFKDKDGNEHRAKESGSTAWK